MDYLFRLADGRRLALWSEKNQIVRQVSGGGRGQTALRTDFLSDFSAAVFEGRIYFAYQNTSRRVMLHLPDGEEDRILFGESIESCRHSKMTLTAWNGKLYLFYTAWSPVKQTYSVKMLLPLENGDQTGGPTGEEDAGTELVSDIAEPPEFQLTKNPDSLMITVNGKCSVLPAEGDGRWRTGSWLTDDEARRRSEAAEKQQKKLEEALREADGKRKAAEEQQEKLEEVLREADGKREAAEEQQEKLEEALREADGKRKTAEEQLESLRGQSSRFEEELERLSEENESLRMERQSTGEKAQKEGEENQRLSEENRRLKEQLRSAADQYNGLADLTRQLQSEGKKWREKYFQEVKRRKDRQTAAKVSLPGNKEDKI